MDAQAIKNLGGALQIIGVVIVVWDLVNMHEYLGDVRRLTDWLRVRRAQVTAIMRRLLGRPSRPQVVHAGVASSIEMAGSITARLTPGPFVPQPDQPPTEQLAAQAEYLNRLHAWIKREVEQRDQAIEAERVQARTELQDEGQRLERLVDEVRREVDRLQDLTTGGIGLRWLGVPILLAGSRSQPGQTAGPRCGRPGFPHWPSASSAPAPARPGSAGPSWRGSERTASPRSDAIPCTGAGERVPACQRAAVQ
jgi:hypothetical protein